MSLDATAEMIGLFAPGRIRNLTVGRGQFSSVEEWLKKPAPLLGLIVGPQDSYLEEIHKALSPVILPTGPEADWLPYLRLLRSKAAHLGQPLFRLVGLPGKDGRYYMFIPREWPYLWEKHMKEAGKASFTEPFPELFTRTFIHQDMMAYATGARLKILSVISAAMTVIGKAYRDFSDFPFNQAALQELERNSKAFKFEHFV